MSCNAAARRLLQQRHGPRISTQVVDDDGRVEQEPQAFNWSGRQMQARPDGQVIRQPATDAEWAYARVAKAHVSDVDQVGDQRTEGAAAHRAEATVCVGEALALQEARGALQSRPEHEIGAVQMRVEVAADDHGASGARGVVQDLGDLGGA
jgi:hypothetical protein